jgi:hypothetical protein
MPSEQKERIRSKEEAANETEKGEEGRAIIHPP